MASKKTETTNPFKAAELRKKQKQEAEELKRQQEQGTAEPEVAEEKPTQQEVPVQEAPVAETKPEPQKEEVKPVETPQVTQEPVQVTAPVAAEPAVEERVEKADVSAELRRMYASNEHMRFDSEKKSYRYNALIKPSLNKKMERDMRNKNLKSKNDLINFLLEIYYGDN